MPNFAACHQAMRAARDKSSRCCSSFWAALWPRLGAALAAGWLCGAAQARPGVLDWFSLAAHASFGAAMPAPAAAALAPNSFNVSRLEIVCGIGALCCSKRGCWPSGKSAGRSASRTSRVSQCRYAPFHCTTTESSARIFSAISITSVERTRMYFRNTRISSGSRFFWFVVRLAGVACRSLLA